MLRYCKKRDILLILIIAIFCFCAAYTTILTQENLGDFVGILSNDGTNEQKMAEVWTTLWWVLGYLGGAIVSMIISGFFSAFYTAKFCERMRLSIFKKVNDMSFSDVGEFSIPSLITRCTTDVQQVQEMLSFGRMLLTAIFTLIVAFWRIGVINLSLSAISITAMVALILAIFVILIIVLPKLKKVQYATDRLNLAARESLSGIRVIRAYDAEKYQANKFSLVNKMFYHLNVFVNRCTGLMFPLIALFISGITLALYWIGAFFIDSGALSATTGIEDIAKFNSITISILFALLMCIMFFVTLAPAIVSLKRINAVTNAKLEINDPAKPAHFKPSGDLEFRNVSFRYKNADSDVLHNISFKIKEGQTVAFIGATGCGKTSLMDLIPRFHDVTAGEILINGVNIKDIRQNDLRDAIGYVPQKSFLFAGTVAHNIKYGKNISDQRMLKAAQIACAWDFIKKLDKKFNANVASGGKNFSGGQRQRICIARALALEPKIFVFDDSFSALDYKTDQIVRENIRRELPSITNVIVAQRIGTILNCDQIFVLEKGKIVGHGTHDQLMHSCPTYKEIAYSQLSKEELAKITKGAQN